MVRTTSYREVVKVEKVIRVVKYFITLSCGHQIVLFKSEFDRRNKKRIGCKQCGPIVQRRE